MATLFCFPDLDVLHKVLARTLAPTAVTLLPARAGFDAQGRIWLSTTAPVLREVAVSLTRVGVQVLDAGGPPLDLPIICWAQLLPLQELGMPASWSDRVPILFQLADAAALPELVGEIHRLGGGPVSLRWLPADDSPSVLVRVTRAPYASVLRAFEPGAEGALRAYIELTPRVWVALGWHHPLIGQIRPEAGKLLLLCPPRGWTFVDDRPFESQEREFLIQRPTRLSEASPPEWRLPCAMRLIPGPAEEAPELWVLRDRAKEQLEGLVRQADDRLLSRLSFVAAEQRDGLLVVLRVRRSREKASRGPMPPPVLVVHGERYRSHLKLPNLFVPCGWRLAPPLRRDAIRHLLAEDATRLTWLTLRAGGAFVPESLPDAAFQPLDASITYVVTQSRQARLAWNQSAAFAFEPFGLQDDRALPRRGPRTAAADTCERRGMRAWLTHWMKQARTWKPQWKRRREAPPDAEPETARPEAEPAREPDWPAEESGDPRERRRGLEAHFLNLPGPLDAGARQALWPELAALYTSLGNQTDAALCWMNTLWSLDTPAPLLSWGWVRAESRGAISKTTGADIERLFANPKPGPADLRWLAAFVVWAAHHPGTEPPSSAGDHVTAVAQPQEVLATHCSRIQEFLETHEALLPVRAVWLARVSLAQRAQGDVLALARTRDRLLERLFRKGLSIDQDLPSFLRFPSQEAGERFQTVRDWLVHLREPVHAWIARMYVTAKPTPSEPGVQPLITRRYLDVSLISQPDHPPHPTKTYADLILAWGLARLGELTESGNLMQKALPLLGVHHPIHTYLVEAFGYRIRQALENRSNVGRMPAELLGSLQRMDAKGDRYLVDCLREHSRILEPVERVDPTRGEVQRHYFDTLHRHLAALHDIADRAELVERIEELLAGGQAASLPPSGGASEAGTRARILAAALELTPRLGEVFARDLLTQALRVMPQPLGVDEQVDLLDRGLLIAAHFDLPEPVQALLERIDRLLSGRRNSTSTRAVESLAARGFRGLQKLGLRDANDRFLRLVADWVLRGEPINRLHDPKRFSPPALRTMLHVAGGWFYRGDEASAVAVLDEARTVLLEGELDLAKQTALACTYASTLGQAPVQLALPRLEELFKRARIQDKLNTSPYFSLSQLRLVEAVVLAVVNDAFVLGPTVRRWLDEDEYLVRRRIHRDMRAMMGG